jgi:hypothetical protein
VNFNPPDDQILLFFQKLKAAGLTITMAPNVSQAIQNASNLLDVVHATPSNFDEWIYNHTIVMTKLASLAQAGSVDRFIVMGDEVQPSTYDISHHPGWLNLISAVRNVYKGEITTTLYSNGVKINGLDNIDMVGIDILSAVDTIGVGWFPEALTNTIDPTVASLINGWRNNGNGIDTIQYFQQLYTKYHKPVWISDIAFHSFAGDNIDSNVIFNNQVTLTVDQQEQANEIDSLLTVLSYNTGSWFLGIVIDSYHNFPSTDVGLPRFLSSPYSEDIKGKIAETVVRKWYRQIMY